jgi:hypothetical protein
MLKRLQNAIVIALFACIGLALDGGTASQQPKSPEPHTNDSAERPRENENRANANSNITSGFYLQKYSTYCAAEPANEDDKWHHDFWCEFKITDAIIATFTVILAIVTAGLIIVGICQTRQIAKTIALARDEFNATHRPKLRVRVMIPPITDLDKIFTIRYTVVNIGERLAIPKHHEIMWYVEPRSGDISVITESRSLPCPELKPGQSATENIPITDFDRSFDLITGGNFKIRGIIKYEDDAGIVRRTGFLRTYNTVGRCFRASDDKGEEYED